jgi:hypothetical protein
LIIEIPMTESPVIQKADAGGAVCAYARGDTGQQPNQMTDSITMQYCRSNLIADASLQRLSQPTTCNYHRNVNDGTNICAHHLQNTTIHNALVHNSAYVAVATRL